MGRPGRINSTLHQPRTSPRSLPPGLTRAFSFSSPGPYDSSRSLLGIPASCVRAVPPLTVVVVDYELPFTSPLKPRSRLLSSRQIVNTHHFLITAKADRGLGAWLWCHDPVFDIAVYLRGLSIAARSSFRTIDAFIPSPLPFYRLLKQHRYHG